MQTLQQLIDCGLKIGTILICPLAKSTFQYDSQYLNYIKGGDIQYHSGGEFDVSKNLLVEFEITTAFDSDIDPIDLPFPEPIDATGCVVTDGWKFEPLSFTDKYAEDGHHQLYDWKDCKPCLQPAK